MEQINKYFGAEKIESLFFIMAGIIAIGLATYFWWILKTDSLKGAAVSLVFVGLIQLVVGFTIFFRSPKDIIRVSDIVKNNPGAIVSEEIPRMKTVMKSFVTYRYVEIALIIVGLGLYLYFSKGSFLYGLGLGLSIQSLIMLILDFVAEARGKEYLSFLENLGS
jgi:hypothetical protein